MRTKEFGDFKAWSPCVGKGLTLSYTSYKWQNGKCVNNATDVKLAEGAIMGNEDLCNIVITATTDEAQGPCTYFESMGTRDAIKNGLSYLLVILLMINYV